MEMKSMNNRFPQLPLCVALLAVILSAAASAQDGKADDPAKTPPAKEKTERVTAVVGGDVYTVTGGVIRKGTILIKDGKITEVGQSVKVPEGAEVIDASGKIVTPGLVAISMQGVGIGGNPTGNNKLEDSLDPYDRNLKYALGVGITTGCVEMSSGGRGRRRRAPNAELGDYFPGLEQPVQEFVTEAMLDYGDQDTALCPCCGLPVLPTEPITPARPTEEQPRTMAVLKLSYGNLDEMLLKDEVFYSPAPGALNGALARHNWRRDLQKAREAIEAEKKKAEEKPAESTPAANAATPNGNRGRGTRGQGTPPGRPGGGNAARGSDNNRAKPELIALLKGETALRVRANTVDEINDMVDLAREQGYQVVIEGGIEAWTLADKLGAAQVGVIYTPRQRRDPQPGQEDTSGSFIESPRIFQETGVPFATAALSNSVSMGGLAGRDLTSLPLEAAFAVRGGASAQTALESVTIVPARMMGLDDRIGSIEKGKDADILILNGDPLDYRTYVEQAIVAGETVYERDVDRVYPVYERN